VLRFRSADFRGTRTSPSSTSEFSLHNSTLCLCGASLGQSPSRVHPFINGCMSPYSRHALLPCSAPAVRCDKAPLSGSLQKASHRSHIYIFGFGTYKAKLNIAIKPVYLLWQEAVVWYRRSGEGHAGRANIVMYIRITKSKVKKKSSRSGPDVGEGEESNVYGSTLFMMMRTPFLSYSVYMPAQCTCDIPSHVASCYSSYIDCFNPTYSQPIGRPAINRTKSFNSFYFTRFSLSDNVWFSSLLLAVEAPYGCGLWGGGLYRFLATPSRVSPSISSPY